MTEIYVGKPESEDKTELKGHYVKTIREALDIVKLLVETGIQDDVSIYLQEKEYCLWDSIIITEKHTLPYDHVLTIKSFRDENVVLHSDFPLKDWEKCNISLKHADTDSLSLWKTEIPEIEGMKLNFKTMYHKGRMLKRSCSEEFSPEDELNENEMKQNEEGVSSINKSLLKFCAGTLEKISDFSNAELFVRPTFGWTMNILEVEDINIEERKLKTKIPATYYMGKLKWQEAFEYGPESFWIENIYEGMKTHGQWYIDFKEGYIYILWGKNEMPHDITVPVLTQYIKIEGKDNRLVKNVHIKNIDFTRGDRYTIKNTDIGLQHDWEMYDCPNAILRLKNATSCIVDNCKFYESGSSAIRLDLTCYNNAIINCTIHNVGWSGILLAGYGPGKMDTNRENIIRKNHIYSCGTIYKMGHAILIWQSGSNIISNNKIHDTPYNAIGICGVRPSFFLKNLPIRELYGTIRRMETDNYIDAINFNNNNFSKMTEESDRFLFICLTEQFLHARNNIIEYNDISKCVQYLADGDAIYLSATGKNNVIRHNYLHHIKTFGSLGHVIRMDDCQYFTFIECNILYKCCGGIVAGSQSRVYNNYFIEIEYPDKSNNPRREKIPILFRKGAKQFNCKIEILKNVYFQTGEIDGLYSSDINHNEPIPFEEINSDYNILWCTENRKQICEKINKLKNDYGFELNSKIINPKIFLKDDGKFKLESDSILYEIGIQEPLYEKIYE